MRIVGIIPARMKSTRLPNKPLIDINGKPMIQHVYERAKESKLDSVIVACDDERVLDAVLAFGGQAMMTSVDHINGSNRIAEVANKINVDYIINIQGDEPLINAGLINKLIEEVNPNENVITIKKKIVNDDEINNPNIVKVITDINNYAMFFSRSRVPYNRNDFSNYYKHIGIYVYKKEFLLKYVEMQPTQLEIAESLEQLRIIENGYKIKVLETSHNLVGVDIHEDLEKVRILLSR